VAASTAYTPPAARLAMLPLDIPGWTGHDNGRLDRETEDVLHADAYASRTYTSGEAAVDLFVAYYATQYTGHTMHSPLNCLPGTGWSWTQRHVDQLSIPGRGPIEVNRNVAERGGEQALIYYWYQSRDRTIASDYWNRAMLIDDALRLHRSEGALVRVAAPFDASDGRGATAAAAFVRAVYAPLVAHLPE
jgi:EpsI family protein